jgi:hypothetical protein
LAGASLGKGFPSACTPGVRCKVFLQSEDDGSQEEGDKDKGMLGRGQ